MPHIKEKIERIKSQSGQAKLMVVTKKRSLQEVRSVLESGVKYLGENQIQEIEKKYDLNFLRELQKEHIELHFIGHLQSNKVQKAVRLCDVIQSVDSLHLAQKINEAAKKMSKTMPIFLELDLSDEPQKHGIKESEINRGINTIKTLQHVTLKGFMVMGKQGDNNKTREIFKKCKILAKVYDVDEVSMGMSEDYLIALEEGSSMIRIGSAIFT